MTREYNLPPHVGFIIDLMLNSYGTVMAATIPLPSHCHQKALARIPTVVYVLTQQVI